jgi:hypothetical protein
MASLLYRYLKTPHPNPFSTHEGGGIRKGEADEKNRLSSRKGEPAGYAYLSPEGQPL